MRPKGPRSPPTRHSHTWIVPAVLRAASLGDTVPADDGKRGRRKIVDSVRERAISPVRRRYRDPHGRSRTTDGRQRTRRDGADDGARTDADGGAGDRGCASRAPARMARRLRLLLRPGGVQMDQATHVGHRALPGLPHLRSRPRPWPRRSRHISNSWSRFTAAATRRWCDGHCAHCNSCCCGRC